MNMESSGIVDDKVGKNLEREMKRESDSIDDFEHLDHVASGGGLVDVGGNTVSLVDAAATKLERNLLDTTITEGITEEDNILKPVPATPPPSAEFGKFILDSSPTDSIEQKLASFADSNYYNNQFNMEKSDDEKVNKIDSKTTTMSFIEAERADDFDKRESFDNNLLKKNPRDIDLLIDQKKSTPYFHDDEEDDGENKKDEILKPEKEEFSSDFGLEKFEETKKKSQDVYDDNDDDDLLCEFKSSSVPPAAHDLLDKEVFGEECKLPVEKSSNKNDFPWNSSEDFQAPTKPLPPVPASDYDSDPAVSHDDDDNNQVINDSGDDEEFESEIESSPVKIPATKLTNIQPQINLTTTTKQTVKSFVDDEIAPSQIFANMGLDAWFNPERLNKRVAALIYWRKPEETGIVFGGILGILLSLAYFSLISVFSYAALLTLTATFGYRIYKTVMQAVQKTSDGHPFKDILEYDLAVPAEKVHEVADVAVAHVNASVSELRRLFLIEDFIDSLKFGVVLWCLTYVGSWFNGMTLIIIGVVALFTLPKVYETNKVQIDQNLALVQAKINELTAKVKAAIPLGKKVEPTKEE